MNDCPHWIKSEKIKCGGCSERSLSYQDYSLIKQKIILHQFCRLFEYEPDQVELITPKHSSQIRERIDFQIDNKKLGLRSSSVPSIIVDIESCDVITPNLFETYLKLKPFLIELVTKGSFRIRLDLNQNPYLWLDLSHKDTQMLFAEKKKLTNLIQHCFIEWGQRKKPLTLDSAGHFKLLKKYKSLPYLFQTQVKNEKFDLQMHVSDFSQPSRELNFEIIRKLSAILSQLSPDTVAEFGSGIGNLTFAIAPFVNKLICFEWDQYAIAAWRENLKRYRIQYPQYLSNIELRHLDARSLFSSSENKLDAVIVNPSRSGIGDFFKSLPMDNVEAIIYLSCYPESFFKDMKPLDSKYKCVGITFIDQFPFTHHIETLSLWVRK
jgi:tRNA/tmRNA/rRNA uracil-C5-methylase (TrmA/RlmC/RlmD family)